MGKWPSRVVRGVWRQALSLPWPPLPWGGQPGSVTPVSRARLVWAWGPSSGPHSVRTCEPSLRAVGVAGGRPRGGQLAPFSGAFEFRRSPSPGRPSSERAFRVRYSRAVGRMCGRGGPALSLWLACPAGGCVLRGWWEAVPVGVAFHRCERRLVSGAVPLPAAPPLGRAARVPRPFFPERGWFARGDRAPDPQHALLRAVVARCGGGGRASPGGGCFAPL